MIYKYKGCQGDARTDEEGAYSVFIYDEELRFQRSFDIPEHQQESLNYLINSIKKEINLYRRENNG